MAASTISPPLLNRYNYEIWKKEVIHLFEIEGLKPWLRKATQPIIEDEKSPVDSFRLSQSKSRAAGLLRSYCSKDIQLEISHLDDPSDIWDYFIKHLEGTSTGHKALCLAEFSNLKRDPDEEIVNFIAKFEESYRKVISAGESVSESHRCYRLIQCLDDSYDCVSREFEKKEPTNLKFSELKEAILVEYNRQKLRELNKNECFLIKSPTCIKSLDVNLTEIKCKSCHKDKNQTKNRSSSRISNKLTDKTFITEYIQECFASTNLPPPSRLWTLDSASTAHIVQNSEFFTSMQEPLPGSIVRMGNTPHIVQGMGKVEFTIKDGPKIEHIRLKDALYVPTVQRNLISMSKMDHAGLHAKLDKGFKIFDENWKYMWTAYPKENFYVVKGMPINQKASTIDRYPEREQTPEQNIQAFAVDNDLMLWHHRMAHCNLKTLKTMFRNRLVEPSILLKGDEEKCEACILGKNTRATYPKLKAIRSTDILQLVHSDVWGPAPYTAKHGYRYILTFLDDYSRRLFCYPMRYKNEVMYKMKNFVNFAERQTGKKIKAIRTDNGLEYCCDSIKHMLSTLGIRHERTNTFSPPQNGAAERVNRLLLEGTRTLLQSSNLTQEHWLEALQTTAYIRNRILHSSTNDVPFNRWYGRKPNLKHLKKFGCLAFTHVPKEKRTKLEMRAKKGVMVGYSMITRGYRIWIPDEDRIIDSKHVTFDESKLGVQRPQIPHIDFWNDGFSQKRPVETIPKVLADTPQDQTPLISSKQMKTEQETDSEDDEGENAQNNEILQDTSPHDEDRNQVTFTRYTNTRQYGQTKGKVDIYVLTPDGRKLRSNAELQEYCAEHNLVLDPNLNVFSNKSKVNDIFKLKQKVEESYCTEVVIPKNFKEAKASKQFPKWKEAMDYEIQNMIKRDVWTPVPRTEKVTKVIGTRWVFTLKNKNAEQKYKARLVALGNNQREGQDYNETYSPVVNFVLIRLFLTLFICILGWEHRLLDVKCAYLYGKVDKDIFINPPNNYSIPGRENYVLKLNKALYGLHQSGKCWYEELHCKLISNDFKEIPGIQCVYNYKNQAVVMVYVDDLPIFAKNESIMNEVVSLIESLYEVEDMGPITKLLGIKIDILKDGVLISCPEYISNCMKTFNLDNHTNTSLPIQPGVVTSLQEKPSTETERATMKTVPYRNLLGSLLYIAGRCRPDVSFAISSLSQVVEDPALVHWKRLTQVLKYLDTTKDFGIWIPRQNDSIQVTTYTDSSWASDPDTRRSWTGYAILLNHSPVIWRVVRQTCVAISPMEAEYIAATEAAKDTKYINLTLQYLYATFKFSIIIQKSLLFCDNTAAVQYCKYEAENIKNRHIDLKFKFVKELYTQGHFDIKYVNTKENVADLLTKALPKSVFNQLRSILVRSKSNIINDYYSQVVPSNCDFYLLNSTDKCNSTKSDFLKL